MYEHFTDRAKRVMQLANLEAQRLNHEYIGTDHILLGLLRKGNGCGCKALEGLGVELEQVKQDLEKCLQPVPGQIVTFKRPQTPRAQQVIKYAEQEAQLLDCSFVGTEHLLLGLIREYEGLAAQVLIQLGVTLDKARYQVALLLEKESFLESAEGRSTDSLLLQLCETVGTERPDMALLYAVKVVTMFKGMKKAVQTFNELQEFDGT